MLRNDRDWSLESLDELWLRYWLQKRFVSCWSNTTADLAGFLSRVSTLDCSFPHRPAFRLILQPCLPLIHIRHISTRVLLCFLYQLSHSPHALIPPRPLRSLSLRSVPILLSNQLSHLTALPSSKDGTINNFAFTSLAHTVVSATSLLPCLWCSLLLCHVSRPLFPPFS